MNKPNLSEQIPKNKVRSLINSGVITWDDVEDFIRNDKSINQQYELINHYED